ncbi:hypothetical protein [Ramlibacter sp.]|uniref:hypothetical protein n=1 Tax=Ramlibacter sp. TaxID=1917967 RepID=UPI003D09EEAE
MTAQLAERLFVDGRELALCAEPLEPYLASLPERPRFHRPASALKRGYVGTWRLSKQRLYLDAIVARLADGSEATLHTLFPNEHQAVFAFWFSGVLRIPQGRMLAYVHRGFESTFESDLLYTCQQGVVVSKQVQKNGKSDRPGAPTGYAIGGMTVFADPPAGGKPPQAS